MKLIRLLFALVLSALSAAAWIVSALPRSDDGRPEDYPQEAYVIEQLYTYVRFENDGTGELRKEGRVRVLTEAGVQQFGLLRFGYNKASEEMKIDYVRVRKPDGTIVDTPLESSQDFPSPVAQAAPAYTDFRQTHLTVSALRPGDALEFKTRTTITSPWIIGHFWFETTFEEDALVLEEKVLVDLPAERAIKLKAKPGLKAEIQEQAGRRVYTWTHANLERKSEDDEKGPAKETKKEPKADAEDEASQPSIQLSTFQSWEELGRWYRGLQQPQANPSAAIEAKAQELTRGLAEEGEKLRALYNFVATEYRYVSLSFGVGRFQPHPAAEVFANGYGDCKDKHTLFASLLRAVGLKAYPVLIHSQRTLDPEVPSPSQFDHLITAIPVGDELVWLDTTTEVAPFGLLASVLRDKQALVIPDSSEPHLVETPAQLPFPQLQMLEVEGKVNALGKLEAQVQQTYRGDVELAARAAFRRVPRNRWDRLGQLLAYSTGYGGEASEVTASDPSDTAEPFEFGYHYTRDDYIDWKRRRGEMNLPLPAMNLPTFDEEAEEPPEAIELGSPGEYIHRARVQIPVRTKAIPPLEVTLSRDYADYEAHYKMEEDILVLERRLRVRESEVPASRRSDYMAFYRVIKQDQEQDVILQRESEDLASTLEDVEPEELLQAALKALDANDYETATGYLEKLVEAEPEHPEAWSTLGLTYLNQMRVDEAIEAFQRQLEIDPYEETASGSLSLSLALKGDYEGAEAAAKKQLEINPFDLGTRRLLAQIYVETKRYGEAVPLLETAAVQRPDDLGLKAGLGQAYLGSGAEEKALALFEEAIELNPSPVVRNNVAYVLATMDAHLGQAQTWAETAVEETAEQLRQANLEDPSQETLQSVSLLVAAWDTLGYVYLKKGRLDKAESYLSAAWVTEQNAEIAEHLLAVYEEQDKGKEAAALRKLIKSAPKQAQSFADFFQGILGPTGEAAVRSQLKASEELQQMRTVKLDRKRKVTENAEFYVLLAPGPRVEDARFISGSESLKEWTETLKAAQFPVEFPNHTPTKLVRRGILSCSEHNGECMFVLYEPDRALVMAVTDELSE